ncbi:hypothetical protein GALMADRAFT_228152 [Galerina marginata CBS 339.88]|uniref:Uncharacterized protein n=1 Tax=Galerina marginata (strain CBS 339.88) TaxID=685588 RepID=A0A067SRW5_GALM3|nr:hypothetical protein GALMADRAFT_228152 [Galerina marginata CBS 339.88]
MPRWIVVDDTDPGIHYTGSWFQDQGSQNGLGNFGVPFRSTLHGTTSDASFSYGFQGTRALITGTMQYSNTSGAVTNPSWECLIDNKSVPVQAVSIAENRLLFCEQDGLSDGPHTIAVNAHVSDQRTFWFDYIQYLPSASVPLDQATLSIDVPDPAMQFGTGWSTFSPGYKTSTAGSTFSFDFSGVSLTWFGFYDRSLPTAATTATYAIDGQAPIHFALDGTPAIGTGVQYNQIFFQTAQLTPGHHTVEVVYQGNAQTAPLTVSVVYVQNGTSTGTLTPPAGAPATSSSGPSASVASINSSNPTSPSSGLGSPTLFPSPSPTTPAIDTTAAPDKASSNSTGPVVGGILGGVALLLFAIFGYIFLRRKKQSKSKSRINLAEDFYPPHMESVSPFIHHAASADHGSTQSLGYPRDISQDSEVASNQSHAVSASTADLGSTARQYESESPLSMLAFRNEKARLYANSSSRSTQSDSTAPHPPEAGSSKERMAPVNRHFDPSAPLDRKGQSPFSSPEDSYSPRVIRDEDSGLRLAPDGRYRSEVEVLPPEYSAA